MLASEGAAGSYFACLSHMGWTSPQFDRIFTDEFELNGERTMINLTETCPRVVLMFASRRLSEMAAAASTLATKIGGPPDLEPLTEIVNA